MNTQELTKKYGKKTIPDIRPGDTVRVYFKIIESGKTRVQVFEGLVIAQKHGKSLDGSVKLRKISSGIGVERTFPLHSPLITKFEKIKTIKVRHSKLYFLRNLTSKKRRNKNEIKEFKMWEEALGEEELAKIEAEKAKAAAEKAAKKAKQKEELKAKFDQAVAAHNKEEKSEEKK